MWTKMLGVVFLGLGALISVLTVWHDVQARRLKREISGSAPKRVSLEVITLAFVLSAVGAAMLWRWHVAGIWAWGHIMVLLAARAVVEHRGGSD